MRVRAHRRPLAAALAAGAVLALPATAHAGRYLFGSDLSSPANAVEARGADTVYWSSTPAPARLGPAAPRAGQLRYVTIRGGVLPGGGLGDFRFVVLREAGGVARVEYVGRDVERLPTTSDPMHRAPYKGFNWDICLNAGDRLGLWKLGHGELRIFAEVPGSVTGWFEDAAGFSVGDAFTATPRQDRELLMQALVETGRDAFSRCPGGYEDHVYKGLELRSETARLDGDAARVRARCPRATYGGCFGRLVLRARIGGRRVALGSAPFRLRSGRGRTLRVPLAPAHAALVRRRGSLGAEVAMTGHDDPSDARTRRAAPPRPGRQSGRHVLDIVLRPE